jgi:hypothetical protein
MITQEGFSTCQVMLSTNAFYILEYFDTEQSVVIAGEKLFNAGIHKNHIGPKVP